MCAAISTAVAERAAAWALPRNTRRGYCASGRNCDLLETNKLFIGPFFPLLPYGKNGSYRDVTKALHPGAGFRIFYIRDSSIIRRGYAIRLGKRDSGLNDGIRGRRDAGEKHGGLGRSFQKWRGLREARIESCGAGNVSARRCS